MYEEIALLSNKLIRLNLKDIKRDFLRYDPFKHRLTILLGPRGVGKTTAIIQYAEQNYKNDCLYIDGDHVITQKYNLYEVCEYFVNMGIKLICIDEIHKINNWSGILKSLYDTFSDIKIIASGSSALSIKKGSHDLSRRAITQYLRELSFREYLHLFYDVSLPLFDFSKIWVEHQKFSESIIDIFSQKKLKVLAIFNEYLKCGMYPYKLEIENMDLFYTTLNQQIQTSLEVDLVNVLPSISGQSIKKIKRLLSFITDLVPFSPDLKKLKTILEIGDERTLKQYFYYLEQCGIIKNIYNQFGGLNNLEKPEKIYLNNTNLIYALNQNPEIGNLRETFFINSISNNHEIRSTNKGDFYINDILVEIGGKNKSFNQIKDKKNSYLILDNIEIGIGNKIPLWLFGCI